MAFRTIHILMVTMSIWT